ncbi:MAG: tetratricopeptide repeat protein [Polyangiaceae bacterium]|nr:tetratricopeptide repeat protein [Polyangiaceae bacterium]
MNLEQRLNELESHNDWQGLVDALEGALAASTQAEEQAALHLRLGHVLHARFLHGVRALKHFQDAFKLNPTLLEALAAARGIYWELGKLNMVQKLLELQLKSTSDAKAASALQRELGNVFADEGAYERAAETYAKALAGAAGNAGEIGALLEDVQLGADQWQERIATLLRTAHGEANAATRAMYFVRASRIAQRFAPSEREAMLAQAYAADPTNVVVSTLYEGLLSDTERAESILAAQREILGKLENKAARGEAAFVFATRWALRHQNPEVASELFEDSLRLDPSKEAAFAYLRENYGARGGDWARVIRLADELGDRSTEGRRVAYLLAEGGTLAWRQLGDLIKARGFFERLAKLDPSHPSLLAFEAQIGEKLAGAALAGKPPTEVSATVAESSGAGTAKGEPSSNDVGSSADVRSSEGAPAPEAGVQVAAEPPPATEPKAAAVPAAARAPEVSEAQISKLRSQLAAQEEAKRYNEYVKTLVALGDAISDPTERVELYTKAADLYVNKFVNQAEAVKAYEKVFELEPSNALAVSYLREMYEKRRDWEKLISLRQREAEGLSNAHDRAVAYKEIALLATERLKKPEVCVGLWAIVLENDADDIEALNSLAQLYERSREYEKIADVLERLAELTHDTTEKVEILNKLGQVAGDRLKDDARAVEAYRTLLILQPDDRKAQEQLKKRYVTLGRWDDLEVFYSESGKWDEFIRVLETNESRAETPEQRIGMLMKVAELWMTQKGKPDRAARAYEKVLSLDANNLDAAERLMPLYMSANNPKGLASAIEVRLGHVSEPEDRLALLREVAALYEGRINDKDSAFERYLAAFQIAQTDEQSQADLERIAKSTGRWADVITAYRSAVSDADSSGDRDAATALRLRLGRVLVEEVQKVEEALVEYRAVYESEPTNESALGALEKLYRQTERWRDLLEVYTQKQQLADDPDQRKRILFGIAALHENELGAAASAIETYQSVLEDDPTDITALGALDRLYQLTEQWDAYADVLRRRIELDSSAEELVDLKFRLAKTLGSHLRDDAGALENYREILFLNPDHEGSRLALEGLLKHKTLRAEAASILENIYEAQESWENLIGALEILAETTDEVPRRVQLLRKISATAAGQLGNVERALKAQARALKEDPSLAESRLELEQLAEQANAYDPLIQIYSSIAADLVDPDLAREYWIRLAAIQERLGRVDAAAASYEKVLSIDPSDAEALQSMEALYRGTGHWDELIGVFRRRIELADGSEREALYAQMAQVYEEKLAKPQEAILAYREVLSLDPTSQVALTALDGLLTRREAWVELAENLETQLSLADTESAQLSLMLRLAALRETKMNEVEAAIEGYRQVLDRDSVNRQALEALERLGQNEAHSLLIAEILEPLYRGQGDFQKLVQVHEVQVGRTEDVSRKVELLHQIAALQEDAGNDVSAAFDTYARALAVDPSHAGTQEALDRLARVSSRFQDLAAVFERLASAQKEPELGSQLFTFAARVYEADVGDVERAIELYRKVLEIDPTSLHAAEALQMLFQSTQRYADMSLILQRKADILDDVSDQKSALYQAASIEEQVLERPQSAIGVYLKILEIDGEDSRSIDALIKLYLGLSRWEELLSVYSKKADLLEDAEEKKLILYQVGAVYERELRDVSRAIDTYQRVLELDPDDVSALGRLDVLYQSAENWQELLSVLTHEAELTSDPNEAVSFQYRIAELYEKHLADVERAVELYREILNIQPDHDPTVAALEAIKNGKQAPLAAASVLEPVYEAMGHWEGLISVLEVQQNAQQDAFAQVDLLHRIARLFEENLRNLERAFDTYSRAVSVDSQNEDTLAALERLATMTGQWPRVAQIYDAELRKLESEPARFIELGLRVAQVYEVQLEQTENAIQRYRQVLELEPENQSAVRALDRLFTQTERWQELSEILAREAEIGQSPDEILEFKYRLGQTLQLRLGDLDRAIQSYQEVLSAAPEHAPTLGALEALFESGVKQLEVGAILEPLYQAANEWEKLIRVREAELLHIQDPEARLATYHRMAEDAEERLMDPVLAFNIHARALKESPLDERSGEESERLAALLDGGWEQLANTYADVLATEGLAAEVQSRVGTRLARVFEEELADIAKAEETYRYVVTVAPGDPDALLNLDRIYSSLEQWPELAGVLEQRALGAADTLDKVELCRRLGEVYEERLGRLEDAIRAYRMIFDGIDKTNEDATRALGRIYEQTGAWSDLNRVYQRELENAVGDVQEAEIRAKMAGLASERLGDIAGAIEGWKRVLDLRGEDPEALWALGGLYQQQGQWAELTDVLERHFDIAETDEERVGILTRRAQLFSEQLGRDDDALETWQRVLDIDYSNVVALRALIDIWRSRQNAGELTSALHAFIDRAASQVEPTDLVEAYRELGRLYQKLEQPVDATEAWRHLLEVGPGDFEALAGLEQLYRESEDWENVVDVKMQRAEALAEADEKVRELMEVTELWKTQIGSDDSATLAFQKILEVAPAHDLAFSELERLHTAKNRWEPLVELYLNRFETREETKERSRILRSIANVFETRLQDNNQAFDALINAFGEDFADDETARYLERMAQATGRWGELINTANAWLPEQTETKKKIRLCLRLGKWYGEDLGHPEYAQPYYQQIMALDPNNVQVMRQMAAIHRMSGNWQKVGEMLTAALDVAVASDDRKAILVDLGELLEKHMGQVDQGIPYYKRALEVDPHFLPALEALERLYSERGDNHELVQVLAAKVGSLTEPRAVVRDKLRMAEIYETSLRDSERAAGVYREIVELDGRNLQALRGLERISDALHNWTELVDVLGRQLDVVESERERVEALLKLARVNEEQFLKFDVAAQRLEQALEIFPAEARAYEGLERCYRRRKQWPELVNAYERHITEAADLEKKIQLYGHIAEVYAHELDDPQLAIDAYQNIVDLDDTNVAALEALGKLYEKQEDSARAIETMTRVADLTTDGKQRVEMYYRIGRAMEEKLGDRFGARERFEMALDLEPAHLPTLAALRAIAVDEADWDRATRYLEQEQEHTESPRARAKLLVELGKIREDMLSEHERAVEAFELALKFDADNEDAALPLVAEYSRTERWSEAEPLAELLVRKSSRRDRGEQHALYKQLGKVHAAQKHHEKALKAYQQANQLDLTDQESIRGIADMAFELQDWASALTNYQKVLTALGEDDVDERTDVYFRLGCIKREQGQAKQAINNFEKALGLNPEHRPTLEGLIDTYLKAGDFKQVAAYKRQVLDSTFDGAERFKILVEIGDLWAEKDNNALKAIGAFEEALELEPQNHVLLHKLLALYQQASEWQKMVDTIAAIADLEQKPELKARYIYTQAQIYRDKVGDAERAVELFNESLDLNPDYLEAFERINKILTTGKDWKQLERSYRKMLHRIAGKGNSDLEHTLWHQLGLIYRDRMQATEQAIDAFRMAAQTKAGVPIVHQILAELYELSERYDEAIVEQRVILGGDPLSVDTYRNLYRLYLHKQAYDQAWCQAAALAFLGKAEGEELQFFEDYRPSGMLAVQGRLSNELWVKHLMHPDGSMYISRIFEFIVPAALQAKVAQLRAQSKLPVLDKRFKQDPATSTVTFAKTFGWAAQVLSLQSPELYVRSDVPGAIVPVASAPPASVAGQSVLSGFSPQELAFICGKHLATYRAEYYIRSLFPTQAELTVMLFAGVFLAVPGTPVPPEMAQQVQATAQELAKYLQPVQLEGLRLVVKKFLEDGAKVNIKRWSQAAELTACRAGLVVSGDLDIAKKILAAEPQLPGDPTPAEKLSELLKFSTSEDYSQIRKALGVAIQA